MLSKLRRICNTHFAAYLTRHWSESQHQLNISYAGYESSLANVVDSTLIAAYSILHTDPAKRQLAQSRPQARTAQPSRRSQSPPRARARAAVPVGRFLRRPRPGPEQVRNAAPLPCRWRLQSRGGRALRDVAPDALPGRSGVRARRHNGPVAQTPWAQAGAQAHRTGHGLHREAPDRRRLDACPCPGARNRIHTRAIGSSAQHRTRACAQKKTVAETAPERLPQTAVTTYETLREELLRGQARPEGVAAVRFHGMVQGLALLLMSATVPPASAPKRDCVPPMQRDSEFVRVLANIVLRTHSELTHVY
jgi:hypothetical protein